MTPRVKQHRQSGLIAILVLLILLSAPSVSLALSARDLVIGSEDKGMRPRVRQQCDLVASIPMAAPEIGSLNAATSGAVALFEARRQRLMQQGGKGR